MYKSDNKERALQDSRRYAKKFTTTMPNTMLLRLSSFLLLLASSSAFVMPSSRCSISVACMSAKTADDSAQALTDYMAKAHEEKIRAMADVEAKYQTKVKVSATLYAGSRCYRGLLL